MKRRFKGWLGKLLYTSGLYRRYFTRRAVIVAFHRVRDDVPGNPISCSAAEFRAFCDLFARYFHVIPLGELLRRLRADEDISRCLVITFDDGYSDNITAARELRRRNLPATFFVSTDLIESNAIPWWDEAEGVRTEWMSWNDVRELHGLGFEIGAHTCTHVDLGVIVGAAAEQEIVDSRLRLERELSSEVRAFSYPYGRVHQITEENRERVRAAGFHCCLSAYGGSISPGDDPFSLKRTPISPWYLSPLQFALELALHR